MAWNESIRQVDAAIRASIERSLADLRSELERRLKASSEEAVSLLGPSTLPLPSSLLPPEAVAELEREAGAAARTFAHEELLEQVTRLDRARTQPEILRALARAAIAYASRIVVWLVDRDGGRGYAAEGFPPGTDARRAGFRWTALAGSKAAALADGRSVVALSPGDAHGLLSGLGGDPLEEAFLIPLVLRDRVAAALYADAGAAGAHPDGPPRHLDRAALQLLVYQAALALETLAFRERSSTPTLAASPSLAGPGLPLWHPEESPRSAAGAEPPAAAPAPIPSPVAEPAPPPSPPASRGESPRGVFAGEAPSAWTPQAPAVEPARAAFVAPAAATAPTAPSAGSAQKTEPIFPAAWGADPGGFPVARPAEESSRPVEEDFPELVLEPLPDFDSEADSAPGVAIEPARPAAAPPAETVRIPSFAADPAAGGATTFQVPLVPAPAPPPAAKDPGATTAAIDPSEDTTLMVHRRQGAGAPAPSLTPRFDGDETVAAGAARLPFLAPVPAPPAPPRAGLGASAGAGAGGSATAEVRPPGDLQGPGRAFVPPTTRPVASVSDTLHAEARRLARLLVSEIKLYNEDQVEQGRRSGDLYSRLREDIERSRQMYEERIDPSVRGSSDYFQSELVRILGGGDASVLGPN